MSRAHILRFLGAACLLGAVVTAATSSGPAIAAQTQPLKIGLKSDLVIGAAEGSEDLTFGSVTKIDLDASGNIYVLDYKDRLVRIFRKDGTFLRRIRVPEGQGPTEATDLSGIAVTPKGMLYVNDQRKVIVYGPDGRFVRSFLVDFMISSIGCPGTEDLVAIGPHAGKILHVFDVTGKLRDSFGDTFEVPAEFEPVKDMPMFSAPLLFDCAKDGQIFVLNPHRYEVTVFKDRRLVQVLKGTSPRFSPIRKMGRGFVSTAAHVVASKDRVLVAFVALDPRQRKQIDVFENGSQTGSLDVKGFPIVADSEGRVYFAEEEDFPKVVRYAVVGH